MVTLTAGHETDLWFFCAEFLDAERKEGLYGTWYSEVV